MASKERFFTNDKLYVRATYFTWSENSTGLISSFKESHINSLVEYIRQRVSFCSYFAINCDGIFDVDDHALDLLESYLNDNQELTVVFFSKYEANALVEFVDSKCRINKSKVENSCAIGFAGNLIDNVELRNECDSLESKFLHKIVKDSYTPVETHVLSSTPLKAPGEFSATSFISNPTFFKLVSLILAEKVYDFISSNHLKNVTIVSASLRGATLAAAIWEILRSSQNVRLCPIDHFGPRHDLLEPAKFHEAIQNSNCIYIGDFLIAGTEVKVLSAYTKFLNGSLCAAFVVGKFTEKSKLGNTVLESLVYLKDCVDKLEYKLS